MSEVIYQRVDKHKEINTFEQELHQVQDGVIESENDARTIDQARAKIDSMRNSSSSRSKINFVYANALLESDTFARYMSYINNKKTIATAIEREFGIPAAISLAQSLNESDAGTSKLARIYKNFFGLTCKGGDEHSHTDSKCIPKLDVDKRQFFMNFATEPSNESRRAYAKRLTTLRYENSTEPVYANCFRQEDLWGWCSALGPIYAHANEYDKSLFTLITVFNLQWAGPPAVPRPIPVRSNNETSSADCVFLPKITTLFSAIQNKYTNDIAVYNRNHGLTGNALLTVNKLITYLEGERYLKEVSGGRTVPKGFTVDSIPVNEIPRSK